MTALTVEDARMIAEQLADVLEERGLIATVPAEASVRMLDVRQVADLLGRSRQWVYEHVAELGAVRMGEGPKSRYGFDRAAIEDYKRRHSAGPAPTGPTTTATRRSRRGTAPDPDVQLIEF